MHDKVHDDELDGRQDDEDPEDREDGRRVAEASPPAGTDGRRAMALAIFA